jgi:hypothetical protein
MDDTSASPVSIGESTANLEEEGLNDRNREWTMSLHYRSQRAAFNEVHHEIMEIVERPNGVDSDDVRMPQRRHGACLEAKPRYHELIGQELWGDDLDRHLSTQRDVPREVDRAHGAPTHLSENLELA